MTTKRDGARAAPVTENYSLWHIMMVWEFGEPEGPEVAWEDVGCFTTSVFLGHYASVEEMIAAIEGIKLDGLYRWCRVEQPLDGKVEFASVEWFEGHWV